MQAKQLQGALFVCLDTFWARPARCLKQLGARHCGNAPPIHFSRAWLISASRGLLLAVAGLTLPSRVLR